MGEVCNTIVHHAYQQCVCGFRRTTRSKKTSRTSCTFWTGDRRAALLRLLHAVTERRWFLHHFKTKVAPKAA